MVKLTHFYLIFLPLVVLIAKRFLPQVHSIIMKLAIVLMILLQKPLYVQKNIFIQKPFLSINVSTILFLVLLV